MAYADWVNLSKQQGSGNDTVNVSANTSNTGRVARSTTVLFTAANVTDVPVTVNQVGKPETTAIQGSAAVVSTGGTVTLTGTSNSKKLTFSKGTDNIGLTLPANYTAAGVSTENGADISGDPGAVAEYAFSIQMSAPANATVEPKTCQIIVTDDGGTDHTCTITLAAGEAYLRVTPTSVDLPWDGSTSAQIGVESNTTWNIS